MIVSNRSRETHFPAMLFLNYLYLPRTKFNISYPFCINSYLVGRLSNDKHLCVLWSSVIVSLGLYVLLLCIVMFSSVQFGSVFISSLLLFSVLLSLIYLWFQFAFPDTFYPTCVCFIRLHVKNSFFFPYSPSGAPFFVFGFLFWMASFRKKLYKLYTTLSFTLAHPPNALMEI